MIELDATNAAAYLRQLGWLGANESATVTPLAWGVSNAVLHVECVGRSLVLKQSRPQLRTRELWFSDLDRVFREADVMRTLGVILPDHVVPRVLFEDRDNYVLAMSTVPPHVVWKESLLAGVVDLEIGRLAGDMLGTIHSATAGRADLAQQFDDYEVFVQLRVEPFYWRMKPRHTDLAASIDTIVDEMFHTRTSLVHADFSPKNLLVHSGRVSLVDYETGHWGDPAFDLGFFTSHLMLKSVRNKNQRDRYYELTRQFWDRYRVQMQAAAADPRLAYSDLMRRAIGHCALCCLARIDGTSPVDYLPDERQREHVRSFARRLLGESVCCWETVLEIAGTLAKTI